MTYKIEKNVPVPTKVARTECPFPFADMYPGDSFVVPIGDRTMNSALKWIGGWVPKFRAQFNAPKFAIACRPAADKKSIRVWRVPDQAPLQRKPRKTNLYALPQKASR